MMKTALETNRTTVAGDGPTVPDVPGLAVSPTRETDVAWCRSPLARV